MVRSAENQPVQRVPCQGNAREAVVALADGVFLRPRDISGSVATRYPMAFHPETATIHAVFADARTPVSAACRRDFQVITADGASRKGTMIGLVCTEPNARGRGHASRILAEIENDCRRDNRDFAVLWSTNHAFFEGLGWKRAGHSLFGQIATNTLSLSPGAVRRGSPDFTSIAEAERIRHSLGHSRVDRRTEAWFTRPMQCDHVELILSGDAYLLLGRSANGPSILFEMIGDQSAFPSLWSSVEQTTSTVLVNTGLEDPAHRWFEAMNANLRPTGLAHWKIFERIGAENLAGEVPIPFFDRI